MENKELNVEDIYIGKPDAKDEIISQNANEFLRSFVMPPNFNNDELINGDKMFISGFKGTGKTALLLYLDSLCNKIDPQTCSTFVLFKSQYGNVQRLGLEKMSKNIISTIDIDKDVLESEQDFEYIWRWIFFKQIIEDNEYHNGGIFQLDDKWSTFESIVKKILSDKSSYGFFKLPNKVKLSMEYKGESSGAQSLKPEIELDFNSKDNLKEYTHFISLIDYATNAFQNLTRSDIPYYIFIDELEAFYSDESLLKRDLRLIRDMIITVKFFNDLINVSKFSKMKLICSIRTEIVNSICQFVPPKEINKIISGYSMPLIWNYSNTNSYAHPIFEIWLKRIEMSENDIGNKFKNYKDLYHKWFCHEVNGMHTVTYVLNNTWNKPRDIVRFLNSTKNTIHSKRNLYTPGIFNEGIVEYSEESLKELKEELNALYKPEDINTIFMCLTGFKPIFSYDELVARVEKYFKNTILKTNLNTILNDLYRIGIIGNSSVSSDLSRWEYKGQQGLVFDEEWNIVVHKALWKTLSLSEKYGKVANLIESNSKKDLYNLIVECTVAKVVMGFLIVHFEVDGEKHYGSIHVSKLSDAYVKNIFEFAKVGDTIKAKVLTYNAKHLKWNMTCVGLE